MIHLKTIIKQLKDSHCKSESLSMHRACYVISMSQISNHHLALVTPVVS